MLDEIPKLTATERALLDRFRDDESPDLVTSRRVLQGVRAQIDDAPAEIASPWWLWLRAGGLSVAIAASALLVLGATARVVSRVQAPTPLEAADLAKPGDTAGTAKTTYEHAPRGAGSDAQPAEPKPIEPAPVIEAVPSEPAPLAINPADAGRARAKASTRPAAPATASPIDAAAEIAAFKSIKVERDAKSRLAAIGRYHREFAKGAFVQEVAVLEIGALCELGRTSDAEARSAAFERAFGDSAFSAIAKRGCREATK